MLLVAGRRGREQQQDWVEMDVIGISVRMQRLVAS